MLLVQAAEQLDAAARQERLGGANEIDLGELVSRFDSIVATISLSHCLFPPLVIFSPFLGTLVL